MDAPREPRTDERPTASGAPPSLDRAAVTRADSPAAGHVDYDEAAPTIDRIWRRHQRTRDLRVVSAVLAVVAVVAFAIVNPLRDPQRVLDVYAPGVRLGAPLSGALQTRLALRPADAAPAPLEQEFVALTPPLLVADAPRSADGLRSIVIAAGPVAARPRAIASTGPRTVSRVAFAIPSPDVARRVEARLVRVYGRRFDRRCFDGGATTIRWGGNHHGGVLLVLPGGTDASAWSTPFAARLVFGAGSLEAMLPNPTQCARP